MASNLGTKKQVKVKKATAFSYPPWNATSYHAQSFYLPYREEQQKRAWEVETSGSVSWRLGIGDEHFQWEEKTLTSFYIFVPNHHQKINIIDFLVSTSSRAGHAWTTINLIDPLGRSLESLLLVRINLKCWIKGSVKWPRRWGVSGINR